jgi:DNA-binding transcriptional MerR regulator
VSNDSGASNRTYLSIGEALDALKIEFPDVTISKIRFLEGQGLVEPERTPSGYRKFTLVDVERLRWVLRQQQESYIPLKVIRERLTEAERAGVVPRTLPRTPSIDRHSAPGEFSDAAYNSAATSDRPRPLATDGIDDFDDLGELEDLDHDDHDEHGEHGEHSGDDEAAFDPNRRLVGGALLENDSPESLGEFRHPASRARSANLRPEVVRPPTTSNVSTRAVPTTGTGTPSSSPVPDVPVAPTRSQSEAARPSSAVADRSLPEVARSRSNASPTSDSARLGSGNPMLGPSGGAALTFAELASASGLSLDDLRLIEEFGLVVGRQKFDGKYYDDDTLLVAKTVVAFRAFGIEPRHLRMYKSAAEREAAFFAQALSPMLHRRGDEARSKAADTMNELRRLGEQLRDAAVRNALRDVLDGR